MSFFVFCVSSVGMEDSGDDVIFTSIISDVINAYSLLGQALASGGFVC